ncbi:glycosyltransferase [Actinomycetospora soli]|uniref:glycosyltransferase n=1 Tax=Actinomycetospora soli TaxID=2893887 RepID=UPI001E4F3E25|nr:glycosyltransferase [Actinomycetospora soli]MCD2190208.1 glycosyltransferase [Actinomycetospora soli]
MQNVMDGLEDALSPHPALRGAGELRPVDLFEEVRRTELVDVVDDEVVAAIAREVSRATHELAERPPEPEDVDTRSPVDLEVIIPAYNESGRLPATLAAMVAFLSEQPWTSRVVVVDNGSVDDTAAGVLNVTGRACNVATGWCVEAVAIGCSQGGKGAAVIRGLRTSRSRVVGFTDADLSTPLETFLPVMEALGNGAAAAIASRHAPGASIAGKQPLGRRIGGTAFRMLSRPLVPGVHDTQCGFKFFDREAVQSALWKCRSTGFAFDIELLRHVRDDGGRIAEIPVTWTDTAGSTLRPVRDGLAAFGAVAKLHRELSRGSGPALPGRRPSGQPTTTALGSA